MATSTSTSTTTTSTSTTTTSTSTTTTSTSTTTTSTSTTTTLENNPINIAFEVETTDFSGMEIDPGQDEGGIPV